MDLPTRIGYWRNRKGWTIQEFAGRMGVTDAAAYQWEGTGKTTTRPSLGTIMRMIEVFDISMVEGLVSFEAAS